MAGQVSRFGLAIYAALGVVLLLAGVKVVRESGAEGGRAGGIEIASEPVGAGGGANGSGDLVVHVAGAVRKPGVYRMPAGSRVSDAVARAGGPGGRAAPDGINLAARLADGQQVVLPLREGATGGVSGAGDAEADEGPISLGSADAADLEQIDGIGPVTAGKIIEFRDGNGGVGAIEDLDAIPGIGPATIESLSGALQP
jgi:competence protein ComEA